jgi:hypothetical protein
VNRIFMFWRRNDDSEGFIRSEVDTLWRQKEKINKL